MAEIHSVAVDVMGAMKDTINVYVSENNEDDIVARMQTGTTEILTKSIAKVLYQHIALESSVSVRVRWSVYISIE